MRDLWNGEPNEEAVATAACSLINQFTDETDTSKGWHDSIYSKLNPDFAPGGVFNYRISSYVDKASTALTLAQTNGGTARYYVQYCVLPRTKR